MMADHIFENGEANTIEKACLSLLCLSAYHNVFSFLGSHVDPPYEQKLREC